MKLNLSLVLRAGLLGAVAAVILRLIERFVPGLGIGGTVSLGLVALVALFTGVYYAYHSRHKRDWLTNIVGGGLSGGLMALISALVARLLPGVGADGLITQVVIGGLVAGAAGGLILSVIRRV
jgi:hypothetical protein